MLIPQFQTYHRSQNKVMFSKYFSIAIASKGVMQWYKNLWIAWLILVNFNKGLMYETVVVNIYVLFYLHTLQGYIIVCSCFYLYNTKFQILWQRVKLCWSCYLLAQQVKYLQRICFTMVGEIFWFFWENIFSVERAANYCFNDIVLFSLTAQFPNKDPEGGPVFPHLRVFVPNLYENSKFFDILSKGAVRWKNIL